MENALFSYWRALLAYHIQLVYSLLLIAIIYGALPLFLIALWLIRRS